MSLKVVDLTFSDESDSELLSLQERLLKRKKPFENDEACFFQRASHVKRKSHTRETVSESEDSGDDLPSLEDIVGNKQLSSLDACKKVRIEESKNHLSHLVTDNLGLQFALETNDDEDLSDSIEAPLPVKHTFLKKDANIIEAAKEEKKRLREEKKQQKELEKALKASIKEVQKGSKPDELLKGMKVIVDHSIVFKQHSEDIFAALDEGNLKYSVEENPVENSILWSKAIRNVSIENNEVVKEEHEELENTLVLFVPAENFLKLTHAYLQRSKGSSLFEPTLLDQIVSIRVMFPQVQLTCVVVGLEHYTRSLKDQGEINVELKRMAKHATKSVIDEVTIEVQLQTSVNFNFLNSMKELGEMLARYSKAIAEAPQRREKQLQKSLAFSWYADADSSCPVKIGRDGSGFMKLWQQQIQQFNNVGPEVAEAISAQYPSLHVLIQAYKQCNSVKEAETLLQDIVVRRNYGPLGSQKRLGPELSYKMYLFFNSKDGNQVLQR